MDNTTINVTDASAPITIEAGGFRVYGNKVASLAIAKYEGASGIYLFLTQLLIILLKYKHY
jgi:hypothetical protein